MRWTYYETLVLEEHEGTDKELFEKLKHMGAKHTFVAVRKRRQRFGIAKHGGRPMKEIPSEPSTDSNGKVDIDT